MIGGPVWAWLSQGPFLGQNNGDWAHVENPVRLRPNDDFFQKVPGFSKRCHSSSRVGSWDPDQHPEEGLKLEVRLQCQRASEAKMSQEAQCLPHGGHLLKGLSPVNSTSPAAWEKVGHRATAVEKQPASISPSYTHSDLTNLKI